MARHSLTHCEHFECKQVGENQVCCKSPRRGCQIKAKQPVYMGNRHIPPHFGPFWAYSRMLLTPCKILLSKERITQLVFGWDPLDPPFPPPLETHVFEAP